MQYVNSSDKSSKASIIKLEQLSNVNPNNRKDGSILVFNQETNTWEISENLESVLDGNNYTLRIRRGINPSSLSQGEVLFDEQHNTLYVGTLNGIIAIAGSGSFITLDTEQIISGKKTFDGPVYVKTPLEDKNPATKLYVDTAIGDAITADFLISNLRDVNISGLTDGSVLVYNTQSSKWVVDKTILNLTDGGNF